MSHLERFRALTQPDLIGAYTHCEITEVIAIVDGVHGPQNVFTLAVSEEGTAATPERTLTPSLFSVHGLKGWKFGVVRTVVTLTNFKSVLTQLETTGVWGPNGAALVTGALRQADPQFVPADQATAIPLNKVLRNNFWGGSHILEFADPEKRLFRPLFEDPKLFSKLTEKLCEFVPVDLAVVTDRVGNIVLQIPVTALMVACEAPRDGSAYRVSVLWRPEFTPRPLRATMTAEHDQTVTGFASAPLLDEPVTLTLPPDAVDPRVFIQDEASGILVGATGPLAWIRQIGINLHAVTNSEPRTFEYQDRAGQPQAVRVALHGDAKQTMLVGEPFKDANGGYTQRRLYRYENEKVQAERLFRQYGLPGTSAEAEHASALADVRFLLGRHGETGAWLWDPYLDAIDILETLFHSPHGHSDLRALGATDGHGALSPSDFMVEQTRRLNAVGGSLRALRLEYRIPYGVSDSNFHDRFLIFPQKDGGALAWSLGTSVNSLGRAHHILQRVDDGQRVSDAFRDVWDRTGTIPPIWKKP